MKAVGSDRDYDWRPALEKVEYFFFLENGTTYHAVVMAHKISFPPVHKDNPVFRSIFARVMSHLLATILNKKQTISL